ncbi:MAG: DEAD/DEAH box helicase, partial [Desulfobacterales bacterium]|nr:DEAD/DEAH box helicase [Desulfobacterales bacterium]
YQTVINRFMAPLIITVKENLQLKDAPPEIIAALIEKLEFVNPKWLENKRMGRWNRGTPRVLKFYDKVGRTGLWIPRGYIRHLINLCRRQGVKFHIDDQRRLLEPVDFVFSGRLKPFQKTAVEKMLAKDFGTLSSATGSGKTVMALYMIAKRKQPALIIVHTKELAAQWVDRIGTFIGIKADDVGFIGSGKKRIGEKITVALVQSLYKCADEVAGSVGFLLVDECHRCPSRTFTEAVSCFDSQYMLGLSATPYRRDQLSGLIFWHLGDMHHEVEKSQLIESGDVLPARVVFRKTNFDTRFDPVSEYSKMLAELATDTERNIQIAADVAGEAAENPGICLILSDRKVHCENLQALLRYRFKLQSELLTGDLDAAERTKVLERINQGHVRVLIATGQLIGEGFDCKDLSTLFLATPIKFSGRLLQYLGRVLRPAPGKEYARVFDYVDVKVDTLKKAARARQRVYRK